MSAPMKKAHASGKVGSASGSQGLVRREISKAYGSGEVSHADLYRAIEAGWRHFWGKRGGAPVQIGGWVKY